MEYQNSNFMSTTLTFIAPTILALVLIKFVKTKLFQQNGYKNYPPIAGTMLNHLLNFKKLHHYMTDLATKHKTYRILNPFRNEVYTSDPANVEYILKTNFDNYGKGNYNYGHLSDLLGDGIFAVDGDKWRNQRKVSSYEFSTRNLRDFSSTIFREKAVELSNVIANAVKSGNIIDIQDLFMRSTLDSIFKVAFGVDLDTTCGSNEEGKRFTRAFDDASATSLYRYVDVFWPVKKFLNIGLEAKLKRDIRIVNDFVYKLIINKSESVKKSGGPHSMKKDDILSRFLQQNNTDPKYLRDIILNFVIAGKDTTAATLSWFIYMLCKHPQVQEKVAEELRNVTSMENSGTNEEFAANLREESLDRLHYLHAALTETLRLYPAVPVDAKTCFSDDTLPDGYSVKKSDTVAYQPYAMGRMPSIWGDDAADYRPERWLNQDGIFQPQSPFKFTAFQAGPRICLGKEFAYRQMKIFSAVLLSNFVFKLDDEEMTVNYRTMITLQIDGGLHVRAFHRK